MREDTTVHDLMGHEYVGVSESDTVADAAELLVAEEVEFVVVVRGGEPVGQMTARDALAAFVGGDADAPVETAMDRTVPTVDVRADLSEAVDRLLSDSATHLIAIDGGDVAGVITERDVVAATASRGIEREDGPEAIETNGGYDVEEGSAVDTEYSNQSICEVCGSLSRELSNRNGQLVCADCREV
ncbi:cyclic nucleotide-binding/CBS domain-containing protein [Halobium palmae]|uniref:Cyclic nucleotide-binding/CBS domain-containing protein n=1 Tax=Halobium palmae TaxID=1776492 RepID=A0ABD5S1V4_9EURY